MRKMQTLTLALTLAILLTASIRCSTPSPPPPPTAPPPTDTPTRRPSPTQVPSPTPTPCSQEYVIKPGDTCWDIGQVFGVTPEQIMKANGMTSCDIYSGTEILIPCQGTPAPPPTSTVAPPGPTHTVPGPTPTVPLPTYCCERKDTSSCVSYEGAGQYIGSNTCVCCVVPTTFFDRGSSGQPTHIDCHDPYDGWFGVVIWSQNRQSFIDRFGGPPEVVFKGKHACFWGLIKPYRGDPEIELSSPDNACIRCD